MNKFYQKASPKKSAEDGIRLTRNFGQPHESPLRNVIFILKRRIPVIGHGMFPQEFSYVSLKEKEIIAEHTALWRKNAKMSFPHRTGAERLQN